MKKLRYLLIAVLCCVFMMGMVSYAGTYEGDGYTLDYSTGSGGIAITGCSIADSNAFQGEIIIPESINGSEVTSIRIMAFTSKTIRSVIIPNTVTTFGDNAFWGCGLRSVTIPSSVTNMGAAPFMECSSLRSVTIEDGVTSIGDSAFIKCSNLRSVTIPNSVTTIRDHAFLDCYSLTNITIPSSVTSIGTAAFGMERRSYYNINDLSKVEGFTANVTEGSEGERYCKENGIDYILTQDTPTDPEPGTLTDPEPGTPTDPEPSTPSDVTPGTPTDVTPGTPTDTKPSAPSNTTPSTPSDTKPSTPSDTTQNTTPNATPSAHTHTFGAYTVTKQATAVATGVQTRTCTVCGTVETAEIAKLPATIKLSKTKFTLKKNKSAVLKISKLAKGDSVKSVKTSKKSVATVKKVKKNQYKITAKKKGSAKITVTLKSGRKKVVKVTVK